MATVVNADRVANEIATKIEEIVTANAKSIDPLFDARGFIRLYEDVIVIKNVKFDNVIANIYYGNTRIGTLIDQQVRSQAEFIKGSIVGQIRTLAYRTVNIVTNSFVHTLFAKNKCNSDKVSGFIGTIEGTDLKVASIIVDGKEVFSVTIDSDNQPSARSELHSALTRIFISEAMEGPISNILK